MTTPAAAKKNRYGGRVYPVPKPGSNQVIDLPSVSEVLKVLAAPGLEVWKQKTLAASFAKRPDLVMLAASEDTRWDAIQQALDDRTAANRGTATHSFSEMVDDGTLMWDMVPDVAKPIVEQYALAKEEYGWELVDKEFTVYNHTYGYAGTSDRALRIHGYEDAPVVAIADVKTGKEIWPDQALQLAFYAYGEGIWKPATGNPETLPKTVERQAELDEMVARGTNKEGKKLSKAAASRRQVEIDELMWEEYAEAGQHLPMPEGLRKDVGFILHLSDTYCDLVPLNLEGLEPVIAGVTAIKQFKSLPKKFVVGDVMPRLKDRLGSASSTEKVTEETAVAAPTERPVESAGGTRPAAHPGPTKSVPMEPTGNAPIAPVPDPETVWQSLRDRVTKLAKEAREDLVFNWPEGVPMLKTFVHTPAQLEAIDKVLWSTEVKHAPPATPAEEASAIEKVMIAFDASELGGDEPAF